MASRSKIFAMSAYDSSHLLRAQMEDSEPSVSGEFFVAEKPDGMIIFLLPVFYHDPVGVRAIVEVIEFDTEERIKLKILGRGHGMFNINLPLYEIWNDADEEEPEDDTAFQRWIRKR